jgi:hypothetical protein
MPFEALTCRLYGDSGQVLAVDTFTQSLVMIDLIHYKTHLGEVYEACAFTEGLANGSAIDVLVVAGAGGAHVRPLLTAGGAASFQIFEGVTTSANGTAVASFNRNRNSQNAPTSALYLGPTVTNTGTPLPLCYVPGGSGPLAPGSSTDSFEEWILKPSTSYLFRLINKSGAAQTMGLGFTFYERILP